MFYESIFNNGSGAFRETGALRFFIIRRAHLLTTGQRPAVVSLSSVGLCALHEASAGCFSRGGRQCRSVSLPSLSVRLADGLCLVCTFVANRCPYLGQPATRLRKPAADSFLAAMDDAFPAPSIFFCRAKRNKTAPCRGQKGRE